MKCASKMGSLPRLSVASGERRATPATPLHRHFECRAIARDAPALSYEDETCKVRLSYGDLNSRANALARSIVSRARLHTNADGDHVIAVCMQPTPSTVSTLLAVLKAGAAYVPLEPGFPQARVTHILTDAAPALIIYDDSAKPSMFLECPVPAISYDELCLESADRSTTDLRDEDMLPRAEDQLALVLYTSGSTGIPKGVRLSHSAVCNRLWWQFREFPFSADETTCAWKTSLTFVDSVCEIWGPLVQGLSLVILPKALTRDPQRLVAALTENQVQRLVLVPTLLRSILMFLSLDSSKTHLKKLKLWVCSGETLTKDLAKQFFQYFGEEQGYRLANFYGSTEVMGDVTYYVLEKASQLELFNSVPIGYPVDNCIVYLLDEELSPVHSGQPGELWVAGRNLACGYVGGGAPGKFRDNPHATHADFGRLFRTGDFGVLEKGVVLFAGRTDSQIKIRGNRVDLQEVEAAVSAVKGVEKGVVLCYGADATAEILAFVTLETGARLSAHHVEQALHNSLTHYSLPQVIVIESVPLLVNGKVDRQALLKMYENTNNNDDSAINIDIDYNDVPAEDRAKAEALFTTVGEVLGRAARGTLSTKANFYELGGNSLNSIYTITQLRDKGYFIEISDFLSAANLGEVLKKLGTSETAEERCEPRFLPEPLKEEHKQDVIDMIVRSFYEKADLERWIKDEIEPQHYADCVLGCWSALLQARLSVVLRDKSGTPAAVALNFDARQEPDVEFNGGLVKIMQFLEFVEGPIRDTVLPQGEGTVLHSFMMATAAGLSTQDNVVAIRALEDATLHVARDRGFKGIFTTNTSPLTQQLGTDVLGFKTMLDYQVNQYESPNGDRPFGQAPDDQRAIVCWKPVY